MFNGIKDPKRAMPASSAPSPSRRNARRSSLPADLRALLLAEIGAEGTPPEDICERAVRHAFDARLHEYTDTALSEERVWFRSVDACQTVARVDLPPPAPAGSHRRITVTLCAAMLFAQDGNVRGLLVTHHIKERRASHVTHTTRRFFVSVRRMRLTPLPLLSLLGKYEQADEKGRDAIEEALTTWQRSARRVTSSSSSESTLEGEGEDLRATEAAPPTPPGVVRVVQRVAEAGAALAHKVKSLTPPPSPSSDPATRLPPPASPKLSA